MPFRKCRTNDEFAEELRNFKGYVRPEDFRAAVLSALVLGIDLTEKFGCDGSVVGSWANGEVLPKSLLRSNVMFYLKERMVPETAAAST